jgi:hypothetical protein
MIRSLFINVFVKEIEINPLKLTSNNVISTTLIKYEAHYSLRIVTEQHTWSVQKQTNLGNRAPTSQHW